MIGCLSQSLSLSLSKSLASVLKVECLCEACGHVHVQIHSPTTIVLLMIAQVSLGSRDQRDHSAAVYSICGICPNRIWFGQLTFLSWKTVSLIILLWFPFRNHRESSMNFNGVSIAFAGSRMLSIRGFRTENWIESSTRCSTALSTGLYQLGGSKLFLVEPTGL